MNCSRVVCTGNQAYNTNPVEGRGNDFRAFESATEQYGSYPQNPEGNSDFLIADNVVDGSAAKNIRYGIRWNDHQGDLPEQFYTGWTLRNNQVNNCERGAYSFDEVPSAARQRPANCRSDVSLDVLGIPDRDRSGWSVV